jgi:hypothetical protein
MSNFESMFIRDDTIMYLSMATLAASLLGVYRHSRERPALTERLRLYRLFFYVPNTRLARALPRYNVEDGGGDSYATARRAESLPDTAESSHVADADWARRERIFAALASRLPSEKGQQRAYVYQNTIVVVVREFVIFVLERFLPHVHEELCARTSWRAWQRSVIECVDTMRATEPTSSPSVLRVVAPSTLPARSLYQIEVLPFVEAFAAACTAFLDAGESSENTIDGSERELDAMVTPELEYMLRHFVSQYGRSIALKPVVDRPRIDSRDGDDWLGSFRREFIAHNRFPLTLFYATPEVIDAYCASYALYTSARSRSAPKDLALHLANTCGMYQFLLVRAFACAQIDASRIYSLPLARHVADRQAAAVRARFSLSPSEPIPRHILSTFVCSQCREFRGTLVRPSRKRQPDVTTSGSKNVAIQSWSLNLTVQRRLRDNGFPTYEHARTVAKECGGTLFKYYQQNATIDDASAMYPHDCTAFDAPADALAQTRAWLARIDADRPEPFSLEGLDDDAARLEKLAPQRRTAPVQSLSSLESPLGTTYEYEEEFLRRWQAANGRRFIVGHRSADEADDAVIWTCASKRYKIEERKTRQTAAAERKVANSITPRERQQALRSANFRRRRDVRLYHYYSLCSRSHVIAVSMLGTAVRIDDALIVACCSCLAYTRLDDAQWYDDALICIRCQRRRRDASLAASSSSSSSRASRRAQSISITPSSLAVSIKCKACSTVQKDDMLPFLRASAYDETVRAFVDVYLCERHSRKKAWLFLAPTVHTLATIEAGLRDNWSSLRSWDPTRDYDVSMFERKALSASQLMDMARADAGSGVFDNDDLDRDDDDDADGTDTPTTMPAEQHRRRRVGADRRSQQQSLVT